MCLYNLYYPTQLAIHTICTTSYNRSLSRSYQYRNLRTYQANMRVLLPSSILLMVELAAISTCAPFATPDLPVDYAAGVDLGSLLPGVEPAQAQAVASTSASSTSSSSTISSSTSPSSTSSRSSNSSSSTSSTISLSSSRHNSTLTSHTSTATTSTTSTTLISITNGYRHL